MRDILFLLFIIGLIPVILYRSWIGALAWTWLGTMNPQVFMWNFRWFPFAMVIGVTFIVSWIFTKDRKGIAASPGVVALVLFLAFCILKTPAAWNPDWAWPYLIQFTKIVVIALLISTVIHSRARIRLLLWTVLGSLAFYGIKGALFVVATSGQYRVEGPVGTFLDGNTFLGVGMIMTLPLYLAVARDLADRKWLRRGLYAGFWMTIVSIVFTYSRGALLGLIAIAPFMYMRSRQKLLVGILAVPALMVAAMFVPQQLFDRARTIQTYEEDLSALERLRAWDAAYHVALKHPLGGGFVLDATPLNIWEKYTTIFHPAFNRANAAHSSYFQVLGEHGFPGLIIWLFMFFATLVTLGGVRRLVKDKPEHAWLGEYASALQIGLIGYGISGAFVSLGYFDLLCLFVVMAGVLMREARALIQPATAPRRASWNLRRTTLGQEAVHR